MLFPARDWYHVVVFLLAFTILAVYWEVQSGDHRYGDYAYSRADEDQKPVTRLDPRGEGVVERATKAPERPQDGDRQRRAKKPTRVLFMTYMRGGSTFLAELLNQHPDATLWFEPVDGVYSDLYGTGHGWFPVDLLFTTDGNLRELPAVEMEAIVDQYHRLTSCDIDGLVTDILGHHAMVNIVQKRFTDYVDCLREVHSEHLTAADGSKILPPWYCKGKIHSICPRQFTVNDTGVTSCLYCLHVPPGSPYYRLADLDFGDQTWAGKNYESHCHRVADPVASYAACMDNYRPAIEHCLPLLQDVCDNSSIVGIKSIRLRADMVQTLMDADPGLKVVQLVRDPRGVVFSRRNTGLLSRYSDKDLTKEGTALCRRIVYDYKLLLEAQRLHPTRFLSMRYEDLVLKPEASAQSFYDFIGVDMPEAVRTFVERGSGDDTPPGPFNTARRNGTESVYKWRKMNPVDIAKISHACEDVLEIYNYPKG